MSPVGATDITPATALARFQRLRQIALDRVLLVSPPYATPDEQKAFISGYEYALRDIAAGKLTD